MTLRRQLLVSSLIAATALGVLGALAVDRLRLRDLRVSTEQVALASRTEHTQQACEASPNWFLAGPREGRPTREELAQPDADVYAKRPDTNPRTFEYFAFDEEFRGVSTAAPRFPEPLRLALKSGSEMASIAWSGPSGHGIQTAIWTRWRLSECAVLLFRASPPPHQWLERGGVFAALFGATFLAVWLVATPSERRVTKVAGAMRESARADYSAVLPAPGADEVTSINALFNDAAALIRQRAAEIKEQQDALRRLSEETQADVAGPLTAVPDRLGDVLRSVSLTPAVREQMQAALRDAHTVALHSANLVMAARLRDRDAEFHAGSIDLNALTAKVVSDLSMFAHACGVMVTATLPDRPVLIDGDPAAFELALANLVDNAIRYNRDGGAVTVDLDGGTPRGAFVLTIADDGPGVNDASLKYFNGIRRFRGDERRRHREDEVGLGLAIVHEVTGRARVGLSFRRRDNGGLEVTLKSPA